MGMSCALGGDHSLCLIKGRSEDSLVLGSKHAEVNASGDPMGL